MRYGNFQSKSKLQESFHLRCKRAADDVIENKNHIIEVYENEDEDMFLAQVRLYLCHCYNTSANGSADLIANHLSISKSKLQRLSGSGYNICIVDEAEN